MIEGIQLDQLNWRESKKVVGMLLRRLQPMIVLQSFQILVFVLGYFCEILGLNINKNKGEICNAYSFEIIKN